MPPEPSPHEYSFSQVMDAIADGVSIVAANYDLRYVNPVLVEDFGPYEGRKCYEYYLDRIEPCPWCNNDEVLSGKTTRYEWASAKSGKSYDLIDTPLVHPDGTVSKLEIFRDITEHRRLEEQLRQSQKMEAIGRLAGGVAHDFNNVLAVILGNVDFARDSLLVDHPAQQDLREIKEAAERASTLVGQLLAFSRRQVLQPQVLDLNEIVASTEKMLRRLIGEDITFGAQLAPDLSAIQADPVQMQQVIINLALNARDAMPTGGKLIIETRNVDLDSALADTDQPSATGPGVCLSVTDTGFGMDEETLGRVFEPFFTTKGVGEGTGLGLSTVYGIVKQSGGETRAQSEPSRGTRIEVYLPAHVDHPVVEPAPDSHPPSSRRAVSNTILVVEDDTAVRRTTSRMLSRRGFTVLEAANGKQALAIGRDHPGPIDLVVADVVMPEMSGFMVFDYLAQLRPELRVLYISGYSDEVASMRGAGTRAVPLLAKPFTAEELVRRVRALLAAAPDSRR